MSETSQRWRAGTKVHRTLYVHEGDDSTGRLVGLMDTPELAALVVEAVNAHFAARSTPETPETAMRPEDVPDELVPWLVGDDMPSEAVIRALLATVLPAVLPDARAAERAKAAEEIEQQFVTEDPETGEVLDETARSVVRYLRGQCGLCGRPYVGGEPCGSPHEIVGRSMARGERP